MNPSGNTSLGDNIPPSDAAMLWYQSFSNNPQLFETQMSESIPETRPKPSRPTKSRRRQSHKSKGDGARMSEMAQAIQKWTPEEEIMLASTWVDVSEDPIIGSDQTKYAMWDRIEDKFFMAMKNDPSYRTRDQLTSEWGHINRRVQKFSGVYEECVRTRKSGNNDIDVLGIATTRYQDDRHQDNVLIDLWKVLSRSPKWRQLNNPEVEASKKRYSTTDFEDTIGSSEQRPTFDFNIVDSDEEDPIPRPMGRKKAKSIASSFAGGGSDSVMSHDEIDREMVEQLRQFNLREEEREKRKREKEELEIQRERRRVEMVELEIMRVDLDLLTGFGHLYYERKQNEIRAKYGLF